MTQDKFESWLSQRHFEPGDEQLAQRIASAAAGRQKTPAVSVTAPKHWFGRLAHPAAALVASVALVAVVVAFGFSPRSAGMGEADATAAQMASVSDSELLAEVLYASADDNLYY